MKLREKDGNEMEVMGFEPGSARQELSMLTTIPSGLVMYVMI